MDGGSDSELDGEKCAQRPTDADEIHTYNEVHAYLANKTYPVNSTKAEKGVIRKRSKKLQHHRGSTALPRKEWSVQVRLGAYLCKQAKV